MVGKPTEQLANLTAEEEAAKRIALELCAELNRVAPSFTCSEHLGSSYAKAYGGYEWKAGQGSFSFDQGKRKITVFSIHPGSYGCACTECLVRTLPNWVAAAEWLQVALEEKLL